MFNLFVPNFPYLFLSDNFDLVTWLRIGTDEYWLWWLLYWQYNRTFLCYCKTIINWDWSALSVQKANDLDAIIVLWRCQWTDTIFCLFLWPSTLKVLSHNGPLTPQVTLPNPFNSFLPFWQTSQPWKLLQHLQEGLLSLVLGTLCHMNYELEPTVNMHLSP